MPHLQSGALNMARTLRLHARVSLDEHELITRAIALRVANNPAEYPRGLNETTWARIVMVEAAAAALGEVPPPPGRSRRRKFPAGRAL